MTNVKTAHYGSWKSPITSDLIVKETIGLSQPRLDGDDTYWIEMRPSEKGRQVIVRRTPTDQQPMSIHLNSMRERASTNMGAAIMSCMAVRSIFRTLPINKFIGPTADSPPQLVSSECSDDRVRYADAVVDPERQRLICVCEDHRQTDREAQNYIGQRATSRRDEHGARFRK